MSNNNKSNDDGLGYESGLDDARESTTSVFECDLFEESIEDDDITVSTVIPANRRTNNNSNNNSNDNAHNSANDERHIKRRKLNGGGKKATVVSRSDAPKKSKVPLVLWTQGETDNVCLYLKIFFFFRVKFVFV